MTTCMELHLYPMVTFAEVFRPELHVIRTRYFLRTVR
jgi:hypothetical protein